MHPVAGWPDVSGDGVDNEFGNAGVSRGLGCVGVDLLRFVADLSVLGEGGAGVGVSWVWTMILFLEFDLVNMNRNCAASVSLMVRRILSFMVPWGTVSQVVTMTALCTGWRVLMRSGAGFLFLIFVPVWKGVPLSLATVNG